MNFIEHTSFGLYESNIIIYAAIPGIDGVASYFRKYP